MLFSSNHHDQFASPLFFLAILTILIDYSHFNWINIIHFYLVFTSWLHFVIIVLLITILSFLLILAYSSYNIIISTLRPFKLYRIFIPISIYLHLQIPVHLISVFSHLFHLITILFILISLPLIDSATHFIY